MTPEIYREIMLEYNEKQTKATHLSVFREREVYSKIPEIKEINDKLTEFNISLARAFSQNNLSARTKLINELKANTEALLAKRAALLKAGGYPEDYLENVYECSLCKDTGFIENTPCVCFEKAVKKKLYTDSAMKSENNRESFETFDLSYYSEETDPELGTSHRKYMESVFNTCKNFAKKPVGNMLFTGNTGLGKSFMCHAITKALISGNADVICDCAYTILDNLVKNRFGTAGDSSYKNGIYDCLVLIMDDLGSEGTNSATSAEFFNLLNYRLVNQKPTVISTNLKLADIKAVYSERIFSRIIGEYKIIPFFGSDIRIMKKTKNNAGKPL